MKYFNKTMAAAIIAGAMSLTSCVDNEVSPEVKQLREAQVAYLNAKTALLAAQAEYQAAMTAHQQAMTQIAKDEAEADLSIKMANFAIQLRNSQIALEKAEANHAKAMADLQREIIEANNEKATEYYGIYSDAMDEVFVKSRTKLALEAEIAKAKLLLESASSPWEQVKAELERNLASATAKLAAEEAALAKLEEVAADPSETQEEISALRAEIAKLQDEVSALYVEEVKLQQARNAAVDKYYAANDIIKEYKEQEEILEDAVNTIEVINTSIASLEDDAKKEGDRLSSLKKILADFEAALVPYEKAVKDAEAKVAAESNKLAEAEAKVEVAQNEYDNDPSDENLKALNEAKAARDEAQVALNEANEAYNEAWNEYVGPRNSRDNAKDDVTDQQAVVDGIAQSLATAKSDLAYWTEWKANKEADIAAIQAEYDDAVANKVTYYGEALAAIDAYNAIWAKIDAAQYKIDNNWWLVGTLENYANNVNQALESKKSDIENTKNSIATIERSIASNEVDREAMAAEISGLEAELAQLDEEISALQAIADKYKALMEAILGGN